MQACPSRFSRKDCEKTLSAALFIHGLGCSGRSFEHLVDYARADTWFTDRYNVVVFEAPRSLNSPKSTDLIEYLARLAASNVEGEVVVVGHSMGGVIGLKLYELLGSKVSHFVNIEGNLTASDCGLISDGNPP